MLAGSISNTACALQVQLFKLFKHTPAKQNLPFRHARNSFWAGNYCSKKKAIDTEAIEKSRCGINPRNYPPFLVEWQATEDRRFWPAAPHATLGERSI